jgi:glyoxylase-like metal-dependent hydrolase (beta-lactamase superfamily II)
MRVEQIYTKCLAEAAYYIESNGEAVVIDPLRETAPYLERSKQGNAKIKYVLETHFHADFVSGHLDLAKKPVPKLYLVQQQPQLSILNLLVMVSF